MWNTDKGDDNNKEGFIYCKLFPIQKMCSSKQYQDLKTHMRTPRTKLQRKMLIS